MESSLNRSKKGWLELYNAYQEIFKQETLSGDLERKRSREIYDQYISVLKSGILNGPTTKKLMSDKKTSNPQEVIPELYALYLEEKINPKVKIGYGRDKGSQEFLISEQAKALRPAYIAEMTRRIEKGPDFEKITYDELCDMYRIDERLPNQGDISEICRPLYEPKVIIENGFRRPEGGNTLYTLISKKTQSQTPQLPAK